MTHNKRHYFSVVDCHVEARKCRQSSECYTQSSDFEPCHCLTLSVCIRSVILCKRVTTVSTGASRKTALLPW